MLPKISGMSLLVLGMLFLLRSNPPAPGTIRALVLRLAMRNATIGIVLGVGLALVMSRVAGTLFFGVSAHPEVDLERYPDPLSRQEIARARAALAGRIPGMAGATIEGTRTGLDGYTPDRQVRRVRSRPVVCAPQLPRRCRLARSRALIG